MDNLLLDYVVIALGILMSTRLSRLGVYTVSEMLENRYGSASRLISAIITVAYDLLTGALFVPIVGALFWRRATAAGALASMAAGSIVVVVFMVVDGLFANTPIIWGILVSLVVFVVVSLLTPRPSEELMRAWERRLEGADTPP
jgi:Na+/proline symporter